MDVLNVERNETNMKKKDVPLTSRCRAQDNRRQMVTLHSCSPGCVFFCVVVSFWFGPLCGFSGSLVSSGFRTVSKTQSGTEFRALNFEGTCTRNFFGTPELLCRIGELRASSVAAPSLEDTQTVYNFFYKDPHNRVLWRSKYAHAHMMACTCLVFFLFVSAAFVFFSAWAAWRGGQMVNVTVLIDVHRSSTQTGSR
jgi:hypothetical protein